MLRNLLLAKTLMHQLPLEIRLKILTERTSLQRRHWFHNKRRAVREVLSFRKLLRSRMRYWPHPNSPVPFRALSKGQAREFCGVVSARYPQLYPLLWDETNDEGGMFFKTEQEYLAGWILCQPPARYSSNHA